MLLIVDHLTRYIYDQPVRAVVQSQRLTPSIFDGQAVKRWNVTVSDGQLGGGFRDGAGDWIQGWTVLGPVTEICVRVEGEVETVDTAGVLRGHRETVLPEVYLRPTLVTEPDVALSALADGLTPTNDPLSAAHELSRRVSEALTYDTSATDAATTAAEAFGRGAGVCQDYAHALLAAARHAGLPARYVTGYLQADADGQSHEAAHAWAELFIAGIGWVGFDPVNRCCPDERYIRIGSGLDALDAAPIRGIARGTGQEAMDVKVSVQTQQ